MESFPAEKFPTLASYPRPGKPFWHDHADRTLAGPLGLQRLAIDTTCNLDYFLMWAIDLLSVIFTCHVSYLIMHLLLKSENGRIC
jgi:hypothetical protein